MWNPRGSSKRSDRSATAAAAFSAVTTAAAAATELARHWFTSNDLPSLELRVTSGIVRVVRAHGGFKKNGDWIEKSLARHHPHPGSHPVEGRGRSAARSPGHGILSAHDVSRISQGAPLE